MLKFYNTLTHKIEEFKPKGEIKIYVCGPTVYSLDHLGHGRVGVFYDVLRRYFLHLGYKVKFVQNITDVGHLTEGEEPEDKIIKAAKEEGKSPFEIARYFEKKHFISMKWLNVVPPDFSPRASSYIDKMIKAIEILLKRGFAYETKTGVYFEVEKIKDYGKLSKRDIKDQLKGVRIDSKEDKKNFWDFALWIKAPKEHLLRWKSPWGEGYPGWHIECTTMIYEILGFPLDIHGGGNDLIFPHHENERAQGIGLFGKEPVRYYLHLGQVKIGGKKMSKSAGNFITLEELQKKFDGDIIRLLLLSTNYSKPLDFTEDKLKASEKLFYRLKEAYSKAFSDSENKKIMLEIKKAIEDNFNFAKAFALWDENRQKLTKRDFENLKDIFGLVFREEIINSKVLLLAHEREEARTQRDFRKADYLRKEIEKRGYIIEDRKEGFYLKRKQ